MKTIVKLFNELPRDRGARRRHWPRGIAKFEVRGPNELSAPAFLRHSAFDLCLVPSPASRQLRTANGALQTCCAGCFGVFWGHENTDGRRSGGRLGPVAGSGTG